MRFAVAAGLARRHLPLIVAVVFCLGAAPERVAEPDGLWAGPQQGPVPASLSGGRVVDTAGLAGLLERGGVSLVDVSAAQPRPDGLRPGALWLPLPHEDIAAASAAGTNNTAWLPGAGQPAMDPVDETWLRNRLAALTAGLSRPLVFYCHPHCWRSWNAAKRAIGYGYRDVLWYPAGIEGWNGAGHPVAAADPEIAP